MTTAHIIMGILLALAIIVIVHEIRGLWRDATGTGAGHDDRSQRTEERKNERIRREVESWRDGK